MAYWLARERTVQEAGVLTRFDPRYWTVDFPRPMMAAATVPAPDTLRVDAVFYRTSDKAYQACDDPRAYPFARIARAAAAWRPDLVIHVGDYLYRENPCAAGERGCAGSPWGYGWDAWHADLFAPAAPLFAAAPWAAARGNHESCARAGQGWWRLLDPRPLAPGHDCIDPAQDPAGDTGAPYRVPIGPDAQLAVLDLSSAGNKPIDADDPRYLAFANAWAFLRAASASGRSTIVVDHFPILGLRGDKKHAGGVLPENRAVQSVFARQPGPLIPDGIDLLLAGHVHLWQQTSFGARFPSQFITGFSGTQEEDVAPLPARLPPGTEAAPGAVVERFASWTDGFGWMTLERLGPRRWAATVRDAQGRVRNRCRIDGRISRCARAQL